MRIHFSIVIVFCSLIHLKGPQSESVFGTESTSWNILTTIGDGIIIESAFVNGDTILEDKVYNIVVRREISRTYDGELLYLRVSQNHDKVY